MVQVKLGRGENSQGENGSGLGEILKMNKK